MNIELIINEEKREITLPKSWEDITIGQYQQLQLINDNDNYISAMHKDIDIIATFLGLTIDEVELLSIDEFNELVDNLQFLKETPTFKEGIENEITDLQGKKWYVKSDFNSLTTGEKISIDYLGIEGFTNKLPELMTIFLRENEDEKYLSKFLKSRASYFRDNIKFLDINNILNFTKGGTRESKESNTPLSSQLERKKKKEIKESRGTRQK